MLGPDTFATAINNRGEVVGSGPNGGFIYDNGMFMTLNAPAAIYTAAEAINDRDEVAGYYEDSSGAEHGFVYDNGTFATLNVPGATSTSIYAINDRGEVAGTYEDSSGEHGFLASPEGGEASIFAELLSAHARHGGVNDLLPGIPGISGGSPHSANGPDMMGQTFVAAAGFASFAGLTNDQATKALLHANGTAAGAG
jgi:probable HAF family extracellular repeat protein